MNTVFRDFTAGRPIGRRSMICKVAALLGMPAVRHAQGITVWPHHNTTSLFFAFCAPFFNFFHFLMIFWHFSRQHSPGEIRFSTRKGIIEGLIWPGESQKIYSKNELTGYCCSGSHGGYNELLHH
jgi:hypothetical protein